MQQKAKQRTYLKADSIYKFLLELDDELDTLVLCKSNSIHLMTSDQSLYEALGSIDDKSKINFSKLVKLLEVTELISYVQSTKMPRQILTDKRVEQIKEGIKNDR